ncbi:hypothetical protein [Flavobacterium sp.]|uniref:hypothetical protein n=1 Tax=Flavobacterium sp. TaxID=239 RepID=UPI0026320695|nr:hypothetical protein [Flavobacterium sp.]
MKSIFAIISMFLLTVRVSATDLIVQENGPTGTYQTISAAITASADGDRIIIYPKAGENPYIENLTINKTLELVSAQDAARYKIQGNITIESTDNRKVTIIGAYITTGNITGTGNGWRTDVNVMGCQIDGGNIILNNQFYSQIVSNILNSGIINISHGNVIGNDLTSDTNSTIQIANSTSIANDTINIIANKCTSISCINNNVYLNVFNNYIKRVSGTFDFFSFLYTHADTNNEKVKFYNNTVLTPKTTFTSGNSYNRYFSCASNADIRNNIFIRTTNFLSANPSIFEVTPASSKSNNYYYLTENVVITGSLNSQILTQNPVTQATGELILPTPAQNGADASFQFYDLDLTVGDAGCYGGSYTLNNYFPITGSSRVYFIDMPFGIIANGSPLIIKADGFDR